MKSYHLIDTYYLCQCGGSLFVDFRARIYDIAPARYTYVCSNCDRRKIMPCREEVQALAKAMEVKQQAFSF